MTSRSANVASIVRTCPACAKPLPIEGLYAGTEVRCPACGATVPPNATELRALLDMPLPKRQHHDRLISYIIAFLVYMVLVPAVLFSGWQTEGTPTAHSTTPLPVAIVEDEPPKIESGAADLQPMESGSLSLPKMPQEEASSLAHMEVENIGAPGAANAEPTASVGFDLGSIATGDSGASTGKAPGAGTGAGGGGEGGGGTTGIGAGTAGFFGVKAQGSKFVFVVDHSGSMTGEKLDVTKKELLRSISALSPNMKFYIIFYDHQFEPMPASQLVLATQENKTHYLQWVDGIGAGGGTDPRGAMALALSFNPDAIWLLSDGLFEMRTAEDIRAANPRAKVQIHTIAFYENSGERVLQRIAAENRGKYRFVPDPRGGVRHRLP